jgi:hypothetical protein
MIAAGLAAAVKVAVARAAHVAVVRKLLRKKSNLTNALCTSTALLVW